MTDRMTQRGWPCPLAWLCLVCTLAAAPALAEDANATKDRKPVFQLDPVTDSVLLAGTLLVAATSEAIIATGEIEAQLPDDEAELIGIDAWVADRNSAALRGAQASDIGVLAVGAWAVVDTTLAGFGERPDSLLTYAALYAESATVTWFAANIFKIGVRRPRPRAYIELRETGEVSPETQEALSFYSLHTALAATLGATASYLALTRDGPAWEKWLVVVGSIAATSVVGVGRILSGAHFTTDVIAGVGAGVAVGVLVPHFHRVTSMQLGATVYDTGGTLAVSGVF